LKTASPRDAKAEGICWMMRCSDEVKDRKSFWSRDSAPPDFHMYETAWFSADMQRPDSDQSLWDRFVSSICWFRNEVVFQLSDKLIFWFYEDDREIKHLRHDRTKMIDESSTHDMIESKMIEHEELWMRQLNLRRNEDLDLRWTSVDEIIDGLIDGILRVENFYIMRWIFHLDLADRDSNSFFSPVNKIRQFIFDLVMQCINSFCNFFVMNIKSIVFWKWRVFQMTMFEKRMNLNCVCWTTFRSWFVASCWIDFIASLYKKWCELKFFNKMCFSLSFKQSLTIFMTINALRVRLEMSRAEIDSNNSISIFELKSIRIESQQFESFNFDSNRFQFETNSIKINDSQKKNSSFVLIMIICNSRFTNYNVVLLSSSSHYIINHILNIFILN
jgi:hypothetical protein